MGFLIVFLGAGLGGAARHGVNLAALWLLGPGAFPWGTLLVNGLGSFLIGIVAEVFVLHAGLAPAWRLFLATGVMGGFTTFSAFSLETVLLWERGETAAAAAYVAGSVALSIGGLAAALALTRLSLGSAA